MNVTFKLIFSFLNDGTSPEIAEQVESSCAGGPAHQQNKLAFLFYIKVLFFSVLHFGLWFPQRLRRDRLTLTFIFVFSAQNREPYRERERLSSSKNFFRCILCISFFLIVLCVFYETAGSGVGLHRPPTADAWAFLAPYITWAKRMKERKKKRAARVVLVHTHRHNFWLLDGEQ